MIMTAEPYLKANIDEQLTTKPWAEKKHLPIFLRRTYNLYEMTILGDQCILIEALQEMPNIDQLQKHLLQIENLTNLPVVLYYKEITRYRRKSLIENRIPFVIEDGQMYLPFLGLDIKKTQEQAGKEISTFTTPAQTAYLYFLYHKEETINTTLLAEKLGFNIMKASRALNELYHANLITFKIGGKTSRSKEYKRIPDPDYFQKGRAYIKTPVSKIIHTKNKPSGALTAGLDALAGLSMINPPNHPVMAIDRKKLKLEELNIVENTDLIKDSLLIELELWRYDPNLFSNGPYVDMLSLYASLKEETDERIEDALKEALREETWNKG